MNKFAELLEALGRLLGISLAPEKEIFCKVRMGTLHFQLEYDESKEEILIASLLGTISPGKFREEALIAALRTNDEESSLGALSYGLRDNLVLELNVPITTSADLLRDKLTQLSEKGSLWKEALEQGNLSLVSKPAVNHKVSPINLR